PEAGRFEEADGDAVVGAVEEVEGVYAEAEVALRAEGEMFEQGEVEIDEAAGAEGVAPYPAVLPDGREQARRVACDETQGLAAIAGDDDAVCCVEPVGQVAVEVYVEDRVDGEGLAGLHLADAGELQATEERADERGAAGEGRQVVDEAVGEALARVEVGGAVLTHERQAVLWKRRCAGEIEHVGHVVGCFRERVGGLKLEPATVAAAQA